MHLDAFTEAAPGRLVRITGTDPALGPWQHAAFVPDPLPRQTVDLSPATYRAVANTRAALAALDSTARRLPNPRLLRRPALQAEAQSTSALEGTYAPLADVLVADEDRPPNSDLREVLNYVAMADLAFSALEDGRPLTVGLLTTLQRVLVAGTAQDDETAGRIREHQVVIGRRPGATPSEPAVHAARFIPSPPGLDLQARVRDLLDWISDPEIPAAFDPVVAAALAHYQFEALHPFADGNGRIGRLLIVVQLVRHGILVEPTLTVSPWFETRRREYYDRLLAVSTHGEWDPFVAFFAAGLDASARATHERVLALVAVQNAAHDVVRASTLRADTAHALVDFAVANVSFTVRAVERGLDVSYGRANTLVQQLVALGILAPLSGPAGPGGRRYVAPEVFRTLTGRPGPA